MNKLMSTLGKNKNSSEQQSMSNNYSMMKSFKGKNNNSIWLLEGQNQIDQKYQHDVNTKFLIIVKSLVEKKFQNQKYLEEVSFFLSYPQKQQTFQQIINQLIQYLIDLPTELAKLLRIQNAISSIADTYIGDIKSKNHQMLRLSQEFSIFTRYKNKKIKQDVLSLFCLERKEKKNDLSEFDKIVHDKQLMKKKHEVMYIDEDRDQKKHIKRKQNRIKNGKMVEAESKKSYGTMNSGSNENESGSGRKSGGSESRSSQGNALAVLLSNCDLKRKQDEKPEKSDKMESGNDSYDINLIMSGSVSVRQRNDRTMSTHADFNQTFHQKKNQSKILKKDSASDEKDEAFIFHRPKKSKKTHL